MGLAITGTSTTRVVSELDVRKHLQLDLIDYGEGGTALIESQIDVATAFIEQECGITLPARDYRCTLDGFPAGRTIELPRPPLDEIYEVRYLTPAGDTATLPASAYLVDATGKPGRLFLRPGFEWPKTLDVPACVTIEFAAGHETLPPMLRHAVLMLVGHLYENREATSDRRVNDVPMAVQSILAMHRFQAVA